MSVRWLLWLGGLVAGVLAALSVPDDLFEGVRVVVAGGIFLAGGVAAEVLSLIQERRQVKPVRRDRPADGRVEIARFSSLRRVANRADERFGRLVGFEPEVDIEALSRPPRPAANPPLLGRVVLVSLFLSRGERGWSEHEIAEVFLALTRAGEWLEAEAIRHAAELNVELADTYLTFEDDAPDEVLLGFQQEGDDVGPFEEGATIKAAALMGRAARSLGLADLATLLNCMDACAAADSVVWLAHPMQAGRSFAIPRDDPSVPGLGLAVCYPREASFPEPLRGPARADPVTVVHEVLHLFGASDKYGRPSVPGQVSRRDVMRLEESRLARLRIDPLTAAEIGWNAP